MTQPVRSYTEAKEAKKHFTVTKKTYVQNRLCNPLLQGNRRSFYRHLNGSKPKQQILLLTPGGNITNDPITCSQTLNSHFYNQVNKTHILNSQSPSPNNPSCGEIDAHGVIKLLHNLKPGKVPRSRWIKEGNPNSGHRADRRLFVSYLQQIPQTWQTAIGMEDCSCYTDFQKGK